MLFKELNDQIAEQLIKNGFRNVVLMGDHGGGQKELSEVAETLDRRYSTQGIHVVYCEDVYQKANDEFDKWLAANGYPRSLHAGIPDTSEMLYLGGDKGWVRKSLVASRSEIRFLRKASNPISRSTMEFWATEDAPP
jgi:creatinine amidohydrolase